MNYLLIHGHLVLDGNREYNDGALLIEGETISDVFQNSNKLPNLDNDYQIIDLAGNVVMPGHFDSHCHGGIGISFDDCSLQDLDKVAYEFAKEGTTSFLTTLSYNSSLDNIVDQVKKLNDYQSKYAAFQGIHIEGPFLSTKHLGIANPENLLKPDIEFVKTLLNVSDNIKQMTIAYELDNAKEVGAYLKKHNVKVMCGHSDALIDDLDDNVDGFTHLFNAMRGLHHRDITLVNCAFLNKWYVEVIADGLHIKDNVLKLIVNNINKDLIMLVSDSSIARGLEDGEYTFISKVCRKKGREFKTLDDHFAGSVVSINDEIQLLYKLGVKYTDLLLYSSLNAFRFYGLDKKYGTLQKGKFADIVISDDDLNIKRVMLKGKFIDE